VAPLRLGVVMTHPTQYHAPWFRDLAAHPNIDLEVLYALEPTATQQGHGFGVPFEWDVPLLDGYRYRFLPNESRNPGFHFKGCDTPSIANVLEEAQHDVVLVSGWQAKTYWQAIRACRRLGRPMLVRGDSHLLDKRSPRIRLGKRLILGHLIPRFDAYLTVGLLNEEYLLHYGATRDRFFPTRHFVDNDWFALRVAEHAPIRHELRRAWGVTDSRLMFLYVGKFVDKKRPMDAVRAMHTVANAHLLMVGDGPLRAECEAYALEHSLPVTFAGFLNQRELTLAYSAGDVLILPSGHNETWGLVVNEAMACGLPAIVSDRVGCGPDLVLPGQTGRIFRASSTHALGLAMQAYVDAPSVALEDGRRAQRRVAAYSIAAATEGTYRGMEFVLRRRLGDERAARPGARG
jgi:glycosyltransferase involved in cell wall biosynthesis